MFPRREMRRIIIRQAARRAALDGGLCAATSRWENRARD